MIDLEKELKNLKNNIKNLEKIDDYLIISDFDDTIFCRKEQLEKSKILRENRGNKGNDAILNIIGLENFIKDFYKGQNYPKDITSKLRENKDLILTAGYEEIQKVKIKATKLEHINLKVVLESYEKPLEMIKYIIFKLKYIPNKIIVYEDRPDYFIETKEILEKFLDTKIEIILVKMESNEKKPETKIVA